MSNTSWCSCPRTRRRSPHQLPRNGDRDALQMSMNELNRSDSDLAALFGRRRARPAPRTGPRVFVPAPLRWSAASDGANITRITREWKLEVRSDERLPERPRRCEEKSRPQRGLGRPPLPSMYAWTPSSRTTATTAIKAPGAELASFWLLWLRGLVKAVISQYLHPGPI